MLRQVEVEYRDGRVVSETLRFVVVHSSQLARQQTQACTAAPAQEAAALAAHVHHVQGWWFACEVDAEAAIAPVWLEKAERIAALAMLTVVGLLVASIMQRQVRLYLRTYDQQLPGNKGPTAIPIAAVVLALFAQVALIQLWVSDHKVAQVYGLQPYHL